MSDPNFNEGVIGLQREGGRVTVHGWRKHRMGWNNRVYADCGIWFQYMLRSWMWVQYRSLNPALTDLCKRCWR